MFASMSIINANALFKELQKTKTRITYIRLSSILEGVPVSASPEEVKNIEKIIKDQLVTLKDKLDQAKQERT